MFPFTNCVIYFILSLPFSVLSELHSSTIEETDNYSCYRRLLRWHINISRISPFLNILGGKKRWWIHCFLFDLFWSGLLNFVLCKWALQSSIMTLLHVPINILTHLLVVSFIFNPFSVCINISAYFYLLLSPSSHNLLRL